MGYKTSESIAKGYKTPAEMREAQTQYYYHRGGRERLKRHAKNMTPEQKARKRETTQAWRKRNHIRIAVLRIAANNKAKWPGASAIPPWELLGCNVLELEAYATMQLSALGLSWDRRSEWEMDHILPACEITAENFRQHLHFSNLQVLPIAEHRQKAKEETARVMERLAREYWSKHQKDPYPGFTPAWTAFSKFAAKSKI